ncbi:MAG: hypothetical protein DRN24_03865 [Thermoplasmata archaeon]|nr:MAG: hypothetical protein DRN24_03865 [Thermoplasmata archaeon]
MPKITLDMDTFKALASDTRLDILKILDGKKMSLKELSKATKLNKATLHEHLTKLHEAGLVKRKEREGHKWVYYKLTWKGEGLLHPENNKIVVMFTATFITLAIGIIQFISYLRGVVVAKAVNFIGSDSTAIFLAEEKTTGFLHRSIEFSQTPAANVPLNNQTISQLSQTVIDNAKNYSLPVNVFSIHDIQWIPSTEKLYLAVNATYRGTETLPASETKNLVSSNSVDTLSTVPEYMTAVIHDPILQYIAVICLTLSIVLLCFSIWRFYKNKTPKL